MKYSKKVPWLLVLLLCVTLLLSGCRCLHRTSSDYLDIKRDLQALLDGVVSENNLTGIALQVIDPGQGEWSVGSGLADLDSDIPMDPSYRFRIASVTKTFTAAAIMRLKEEGLLQLDDPIVNYIPDLHIPLDSVITIRHLLSHRSGMVDYSNETDYCTKFLDKDPLHSFTPQELLQVSIDAGFNFYPGTQFKYCNTGYLVAALIIERVNADGLSYQDFARTYLIEPLGLKNTFVPLDEKIPGNYAHGYQYSDAEGFQDATILNQSFAFASGNMISTVADLARWARALYGGEVLDEASTAEMMDLMATGDPNQAYYGLGCTYNEGLGYGHDGATAGYFTVMRYDTDNGVAIATYMNEASEDARALTDILYEIGYSAKRILGYEIPE